MATMQLPAMGYGLRYEYGMFKQRIENGWQREQPDNRLRRSDPWEVARLDDRVEIKLNHSFSVRGGTLDVIRGRPSTRSRRRASTAVSRRGSGTGAGRRRDHAKLTRAGGNQAPIQGLKIATSNGWFAARPSGTGNIIKIYAESFRSAAHLGALVREAHALVNRAIGSGA